MAEVLGQTITVINKSGKVVSTSRHLVDIFNEAKAAYRERKAELRAQKNTTFDQYESASRAGSRPHSRAPSRDGKRDSRDIKGDSRDSKRDSRDHKRDSKDSTRDSKDRRRRSKERRSKERRSKDRQRDSRDYGSRERKYHSRAPSEQGNRPPFERGYTDSFYANDRSPKGHSSSGLRNEYHDDRDMQVAQLRRSSTFPAHLHTPDDAPRLRRSVSDASIDMDLAYGELPPPLPERTVNEEMELRNKASNLNSMLEEFNCLQHSVRSTIKNLEENPDAMAAVALTLAEISGLISRVGPGALTALKGSFPAVVALLISPEFLIAAGVGVGVTIVALGGYRIVKRIKSKKAAESETKAEELEEVSEDMNRIESWRRGVDVADTQSITTSVEGEFITPGASRRLREEAMLVPANMGGPRERSRDSKEDSKENSKMSKKEKEEKREKEKKEKADKKEEERLAKQARKRDKEEQKELDRLERLEKKGQEAAEKKKAMLSIREKEQSDANSTT